ncbi:MAG: hypothetical protein F9K30_22950 [Dechloromonas sp.]|nr:MAG: hypothetical protein F9K30_22950 [Dechloromonas sp.]
MTKKSPAEIAEALAAERNELLGRAAALPDMVAGTVGAAVIPLIVAGQSIAFDDVIAELERRAAISEGDAVRAQPAITHLQKLRRQTGT